MFKKCLSPRWLGLSLLVWLLPASPGSAQDFMVDGYRAHVLIGEPGLLPDVDYVSFTGDFGFAKWLPDPEVLERELVHESELLSRFQLNVVNLEFMLPGASGDTLDTRIDEVMLHVLATAGYDLVTRANNHAMDHGRKGLDHNAEHLREAGFPLIGTRDSPVYFWNAGDKMIAIYAMTEFLDYKDPDEYILRINDADMRFVQERAARADFRIAFVHLGSLSSFVSPHEQKQTTRLFEHGADLVVCSGNHYIKGFVMEAGGPVVYSTGDNLFSQGTPNTEPVGMYVVAGIRSGELVQLFTVPFRNAIRDGDTGPLDAAQFAEFKETLAARSVTGSDRYYSDPRVTGNIFRRIRHLDFGGRHYTPRHVVYFVRIVFHNYPIPAAIVSLVLLVGFVVVVRWLVRLGRRRLRPSIP